MNGIGWKRASISMLAALIALQSLWVIVGTGGVRASAATPLRVWQPVGTGVVDNVNTSSLSLAFHNDTPVIIYNDLNSGGQIRVKNWESGAWTYLGDNGSNIDTGHSLSFASSQDGTLNAVFLGLGSERPGVLTFDENNWTKLGGADLTSNASQYPSIALDADGKVYAMYQDANAGRLTLRIYDGTTWSTLEEGLPGWYPALTIGSDGKPLLAHAVDGSLWPIVKSREDAGNWSTVGVYPFSTIFGFHMRIKEAGDGSVYMAYTNGNSPANGQTSIWRFTGSVWEPLGSLPSNHHVGPALAIDPTDQQPVIAFLDRPDNYPEAGRVHVMKWNGGKWEELGQAGASGDLVETPALAIGSDGTPYLAYADIRNGHKPTVLAFLPDTTPPVLVTRTPASGATDVAQNDRLTLTFNEDVKAVSGKTIEICPENSACEHVDAGSSRVTVSGRTATVAPATEWKAETNYTVHIEAGAFADLSGNPSAEVADWTFMTAADTTAPEITNAEVNRNVLTFDFTEELVVPEGRYFENSDFVVRVNGVSVQLEFVVYVSETNHVIVTLSQPVASTDVVTVAYFGADDITDMAGNVLSGDPVEATNTTPGTFQTPPQLRMSLRAGYAMKAGDAIVRFVPSTGGAAYIQFGLLGEPSNPPTLNSGSIVKSDFVIKDITAGTEFAPSKISVNNNAGLGIYDLYLTLPDGVSLTPGHSYELAMSASASGDEIVLPANPTTTAAAYLALWKTSGVEDVIDEYQFENVTLFAVDMTSLETAITAAQTKHDEAVEGEADGNYEVGSKAVLQAAIDAAKDVRDDTATTQSQVEAAITALRAAVTAFNASCVVVDLSALETAITAAQTKHDEAVEGEADGNYEAGSKAVLQAAIDAAKDVRDDAATTQSQVEAAITALSAAVTAFDDSLVVVDMTALEAAITAAQTKHDEAVEGGADGNYEVGSKAALQAAIDAAKDVRDNAATTKAEVGAALTALGAAVTAFDDSLVVVDLTALEAAITAAQTKHDEAVEGGADGNYEVGSKAVLQAAIDAAKDVRDDVATTLAEVDAAITALRAAFAAFNASCVVVDLSALETAITAAQTKHDEAVEGEADGNYEAGSKAVLQAAIDAAKDVRDDATTTQAQVEAAITALSAAISAFNAKYVVVDLTALETAITAAQTKHDAAVEGGARGNYKAGSKAALQAAIDAAEGVRDDAASTQAQVETAIRALSAAVTTFDTKKIVNSGTPVGGTPGGGTIGGGTSDGAEGDGKPASATYTLDVSIGGVKVGTLSVKRTTDPDGQIKDLLDLSETFAEQAVDRLLEAGMDRLVIDLPASQTPTQVFAITLTSKAATILASGGISLVMRTPEAGIFIPSSSFQGVDETLTFTISPVNSADRSSIEQRAKGSAYIRTKAGNGEVTVIGQPVEIETNLQHRNVTLTLTFPGDSTTNDVGIYIEHSDGTKELVRGSIIESNGISNTRSIQFDVNKFSTFAIVNVAGWSEHEKSDVVKFLDAPYIFGYDGGLFKPNASLTRAEMAAILARVIGGKTESGATSFQDVPTAYWAREAIEKVVALGIMSGYPEGAFRPQQPITRAEMAMILSKLPIKVDQGAESTGDFLDTAGHWAQAAIRQARAAGLLNGYADGTFRPEQALSRAEAVVILNKLIGRQSGGNTEPLFVDVPKTHWAFEAIQAATSKR